MNISIELLVLKLRVMANLLDIVGLIGLAVFVASMIWMVIQVANFNSPLPPLVGILLSLVLVAGGLACSPVSGESAGLTAAAWLCDLLGVDLGEARKFAEEEMGDFREVLDAFEDFDISDLFGGEDENPDGNSEEAPGGAADENSGPAKTGAADEPEAGTVSRLANTEVNAAASNLAYTAKDGYPYEGTLDGWRVRMTLPAEWKDLCIVSQEDNSLRFLMKNSFPREDYDGLVFSFSVVKDREYIHEYYDPVLAIERDGLVLIAHRGSAGGLEFDPELPEIAETYNRMMDDVALIMGTLEAERI